MKKKTSKKTKGFSLIELLIVVAIILIIAAIAIPNLLRARRSANEGSATASMRTIGSGELLYRSTNGNFTNLAGLSADSIIDNVLGSGRRAVMLLPRLQEPPPTCNSLPMAHLPCPPVQRRLVRGSSSPMKPRLFDSPSVPLRPLVPVPSATRSNLSKQRKYQE